jgi:aspartyl protease family protein
MLKHAAILAVAVLSALISAQGMVSFASARATPAVAAQAAAVEAAAVEAAQPVEAGPPASGQAAQIVKAADGHYWAQAQVDGRWVKFLVDTGASAVALTGDDARRLGIDLAKLEYDRPVITANGPTRAATVTLGHVTVAGARVDGVQAMVVPHGLPTSLLGMSYLGRLSRFEATRTALVLRP